MEAVFCIFTYNVVNKSDFKPRLVSAGLNILFCSLLGVYSGSSVRVGNILKRKIDHKCNKKSGPATCILLHAKKKKKKKKTPCLC